MANLFDYINWRGDLPWSQCPLNEVDGLLFSAFCYIDPPKELESKNSYTISDLYKAMQQIPEKEISGFIRNDKDLQLLKDMATAPRYQSVEILAFQEMTDHESETQFAAYCLRLCDDQLAVIFRGTDHTITGWKEDFNMSFLPRVPGQVHAKDFLEKIAAQFTGSLIVCGHSKGGNLAVYAATTCQKEVADRIRDVYNYDGPGFKESFLVHPNYQNMLSRLHSFLPESSIVGLLFDHAESFDVVESTNIGVTQHEPYSWSVMGGSIVRSASRSNYSLVMDQALKDWLAGMTREEREGFVDNLFGLLEESDAKDLNDIMKPKTIWAAGKQMSSYSEKERNMLFSTANALRLSLANSIKMHRKQSDRTDS